MYIEALGWEVYAGINIGTKHAGWKPQVEKYFNGDLEVKIKNYHLFISRRNKSGPDEEDRLSTKDDQRSLCDRDRVGGTKTDANKDTSVIEFINRSIRQDGSTYESYRKKPQRYK